MYCKYTNSMLPNALFLSLLISCALNTVAGTSRNPYIGRQETANLPITSTAGLGWRPSVINNQQQADDSGSGVPDLSVGPTDPQVGGGGSVTGVPDLGDGYGGSGLIPGVGTGSGSGSGRGAGAGYGSAQGPGSAQGGGQGTGIGYGSGPGSAVGAGAGVGFGGVQGGSSFGSGQGVGLGYGPYGGAGVGSGSSYAGPGSGSGSGQGVGIGYGPGSGNLVGYPFGGGSTVGLQQEAARFTGGGMETIGYGERWTGGAMTGGVGGRA